MAESKSVELVIEGRARDVAGFSVRRTLPSLHRRAVGPFVFVDHFGPIDFPPGRSMDVKPHPHIGLATVTYLFEGEIIHRDSIGSCQSIHPGDLNWMTAGRGIAHSERSPENARTHGGRSHGLQLWVALPISQEETPPTFAHYPESALPKVQRGDAHLTVIAGSAYDSSSPVRVASPLFYVDAWIEPKGELAMPTDYAERAAYVVEGTATCDGQHFGAGTMIVFRSGKEALLRGDGRSKCHAILIGGAPLDGERHIWWNFVSSSTERIEQAKRDWREGRFDKVVGDEIEFVPLPDR